jgi:hypothetical protein
VSTIYYTGSSLDGFIVDEQNSLDWLTSRNIDADGPFGYRTFIESVGALVMGATTYRLSGRVGGGWRRGGRAVRQRRSGRVGRQWRLPVRAVAQSVGRARRASWRGA